MRSQTTSSLILTGTMRGEQSTSLRASACQADITHRAGGAQEPMGSRGWVWGIDEYKVCIRITYKSICLLILWTETIQDRVVCFQEISMNFKYSYGVYRHNYRTTRDHNGNFIFLIHDLYVGRESSMKTSTRLTAYAGCRWKPELQYTLIRR